MRKVCFHEDLAGSDTAHGYLIDLGMRKAFICEQCNRRWTTTSRNEPNMSNLKAIYFLAAFNAALFMVGLLVWGQVLAFTGATVLLAGAGAAIVRSIEMRDMNNQIKELE